MSDERAARIGANEALFREVNEHIDGLNTQFGGDEAFSIVCECGNGNCAEQISVSQELYERVRAEGELFLIVPGHERPEAEDVVEEEPGYSVVRKREGLPAEIARSTDPRS
jgi:hypothetical protein